MTKITLFSFILLIMIGIVLISYSRLGMFMIAGGSDSTLAIIRSPKWIVIVLSILCITLLFICLWYSKYKYILLSIFFVSLIVWGVTGRIIGLYPDGRIITGWYFIVIDEIDFRDYEEDYEYHASHTSITPYMRWFIEVDSQNHRKILFIGPLLKSSILKLFKDRGYKVVKKK